ncbi:hypothetical protein [Acidovorax sp. SUPP2539]|uniref:hypothetical protein n=1 Tax=Acidovorax sp. SUPP2539 TaxID=2920878 RepID=UPI0023DE36B3|nr:hypothetical protein [Acidovorax sp. SUPP2539]GKS91228.1 hypothetical protein AVTE2539_17705 [Acidovorax sp. SUPP2539]
MANPWDNDEIVTPAPAPAAPAQSIARPPAAAAAPAPAAANPWDADEIVTPAPAKAPAQPQRTLGEQVGRQVGLTARHAINGVAALPAMAADAVTGVANTVLNKTRGQGNGFRFQKSAQALDDTLTNLGLPTPETAQERVVGDATSALAGAGGVIKAGQALASGAAANTTARAVGDALAKGPGVQLTSAATSGGASGATREAGGGAATQLAAGVLGAVLPGAAAARRVVTDAGRQTRSAASNAAAEGYVIPPADLSPNLLTEALSGFSGKIKTAQVASARNQTVSNSLARRALGIGDDVDLNVDTLEGIRRTAAQAYAPVASSGTVIPGKSYGAALDRALSPFTSQGSSFPGARVPKVVDDINALRTGQFDAGDALNMIRTMRESADISYRAGEALAGKAYKQAAGALEDAIEGHLKGLGQPGGDLLKSFRDARQTIAKTYSVQGALNSETGAVNAIKLAADLAKGRPLSGDLRTIAETGRAFPKATQALKEAPKATSPLDWFGGTAAAAGTGNVLPLAAVVARPAVRAGLLSSPMQRLAIRTAGTEVQRLPEGAAGIAAGVAGRAGEQDQQPQYRNRLQAGAAARASGGVVVPVPGGFDVQPR